MITRAFALVIATVWLCAWGSGCAGSQKPKSTIAELSVVSAPKTASVHIDEYFAGTGAVLEIRPVGLKPGRHLITVSAPHYFPHDIALDMPPGLTTLKISLRAIPASVARK